MRQFDRGFPEIYEQKFYDFFQKLVCRSFPEVFDVSRMSENTVLSPTIGSYGPPFLQYDQIILHRPVIMINSECWYNMLSHVIQGLDFGYPQSDTIQSVWGCNICFDVISNNASMIGLSVDSQGSAESPINYLKIKLSSCFCGPSGPFTLYFSYKMTKKMTREQN